MVATEGPGQRRLCELAVSGDLEGVVATLAAGESIAAVDEENNTALHLCTKHGHFEVAKLLIERGARVNTQNASLHIALHGAVWRGHLDCSRLLVEHNAELENKDEYGDASTKLAAFKGHADIMRVLLENGASTETRDSYGNTPMHVAATLGHTEVVRVLVQHGAPFDVVGKDDCLPIHNATWQEHVEIASLLISGRSARDRSPLDRSDSYQATPLSLAATKGNARIARMLVEAGAPVDALDNHRNTPLHTAVWRGHLEVAELLMREHKAPLEAVDQYGDTPLHLAAYKGRHEILPMLLSQGVALDIANLNGWTALHKAVDGSDVRTTRTLLEARASTACKTNDGQRALRIAVGKQSAELTSLLIEHGASVDDRDADERTPLHVCAKEGHTDIAALILRSAADVAAFDATRQRPLHLAAAHGHLHTVSLLLHNGAPIAAKDGEGATAYDVATATGEEYTALLLHNWKKWTPHQRAMAYATDLFRSDGYDAMAAWVATASDGQVPWSARERAMMRVESVSSAGSWHIIDTAMLQRAIGEAQGAVDDASLAEYLTVLERATEAQVSVSSGKGCSFSFVRADKIRDMPEAELPTLITLQQLRIRQPDWVEQRTLMFDQVCQGAYKEEFLAVSHRWDSLTHPDPTCHQLAELRAFLRERPRIKLVFFECSE